MIINSKLFTCIFSVFVLICAAENSDYIQCANSVGSISHIAEDGAIEVIPTESFQICKNKNDYCYTFWQEDPNNGSIEIKSQGMYSLSVILKIYHFL